MFGVRRLDGEAIERSYVERCCAASADAGPDRQDIWLAPRETGDVALGHCLLATTDDAQRERQPSSLDGLWISADARIDNRAEVAEALAARGDLVAPDATDERYILHAYRAWGLDALPRLEGDFAFVLWDAPRRTLIAARDCVGIRPLFYARDSRRVMVASEIRQLFVERGVSHELDPDVVSDYLRAAHRADAGSSFYRAIRQVRPGHFLRVTADGVDEQRYWTWREPDPIRYATSGQYAEHLTEVFRAAVAARMRTSAPVGLLLSGGLDSSAIAGFAGDVLRRRGSDSRSLRTYSMVFDDHPDCDEREYIEPLTDALGVDRHWLYPERKKLFSRSPRVDEPDASTLAEPHWDDALADLSAAGGRVMFGGDAGETVFLGQSNWHFIDLLRRGNARGFLRELRGYVATWGEWPRLPWRGLVAAQLPDWAHRRLSSAMGRPRPRRRDRTFRSYAHQFAFDSIVSDAGTGAGWWVPAAHKANRYGVVYCYPFLDRRLLQFLFAVPVEQFFERGVDRAVLRRALAGLVPECVRMRTDPTAFDSWFGRVARGPELRGALQTEPWPTLPYLPARDVALSSGTRAWRQIALAQFVVWYHEVRPAV